MSYLVLARKWRPMRFDDLIGQEHVARTLGNAIQSGRVAHAFLFTGVRGVGKTTSARILAKSLNCMGDPDGPRPATDPGPTTSPCLKCAACQEIAAGTDMDVREIDGASYNGVDEVRRLQDSLPYRPSRDRYKVFIVDEVHMLSQSAWNAFLKTLEEPPPHVKFIFATTEVHKVPVTILSRVQRFDFKLIPTQMIAERLRYVLAQENVRSDDAALSILAREAAGSMRDAMSLLDQVIAYDAQQLDGATVSRVLGVASRQVLHDLALALVRGEPKRCLDVVSALANQGYDLTNVARDFLALLRDLVVAKVCADPGDLLDMADDEKRDVMELARQSEADDLLRLHQAFSQAFDDVVRGPQPRAGLEMLLVRLARRPPLLPVDDLMQRLGSLERRLSAARPAPSAAPAAARSNPAPLGGSGLPPGRGREGGTPPRARPAPDRERGDEPPSAGPAPAPPDAAPNPPPGALSGAAPNPPPSPPPGAAPSPPPAAPPPSARPVSTPPSAAAPRRGQPPDFPDYPFPDDLPSAPRSTSTPPSTPAPRPRPPREEEAPRFPEYPFDDAPPARAEPSPRAAPPPRASAPPPRPRPEPTFGPDDPSRRGPPGNGRAPGRAAEVFPEFPGDDPDESAKPKEAAPKLVLPPRKKPHQPDPTALEHWRRILEVIRDKRPELAAFMERAAPLCVTAEELHLGYEPGSFFVGQANDRAAIELLTQTAAAHFGTTPKITVELDSERAKDMTTVADLEEQAREERTRRALAEAKQHPRIADAIEVLGARLKDLKLAHD